MRKGMLVTILAFLALSVLVILSSCSGGGGVPLTIGGGVSDDETGYTSAVFFIFEGGAFGDPVDDAVVTINGTELTNFAGMYMSFLVDLDIDPLEDVVLEVQRESTLITATLPMPEKPVVVEPVAAETVIGTVIAEWTSATDPDIFGIAVDSTLTNSGVEYSVTVAGSLRIHSMSGVFDTASDASEYTLMAVNYTDSIPGAAADSVFEVESSTTSPTFNPD